MDSLWGDTETSTLYAKSKGASQTHAKWEGTLASSLLKRDLWCFRGVLPSMALETIQETISASLPIDLTSAETITVIVQRGEESIEVEVLRKVELRNVQKCLCTNFHERFPLMCATLTNCERRTFNDFNDMPFEDAEPNDTYEVAFELTRDMFWFDWEDRKSMPTPDPRADDAEMLLFSLE